MKNLHWILRYQFLSSVNLQRRLNIFAFKNLNSATDRELCLAISQRKVHGQVRPDTIAYKLEQNDLN